MSESTISLDCSALPVTSPLSGMLGGSSFGARSGLVNGEVLDFHRVAQSVPVFCQQFGHQPPVALLGGGFRAKKGHPSLECARLDNVQNASLSHQFQERTLVLLPVSCVSVSLADLGSGSKEELADVLGGDDAIQEKPKVRVLGESGKLAA